MENQQTAISLKFSLLEQEYQQLKTKFAADGELSNKDKKTLVRLEKQ